MDKALIRWKDPIYISETVEKTMNPTFRHVDWTHCGPAITRLDHVVVRVWVKGDHVDEWQQLLKLELQLAGLQYVEKSVSSKDEVRPFGSLTVHSLTNSIVHYRRMLCYSTSPMAFILHLQTR